MLLNFWQWAVMHSPRFQYYQIRLNILPVTVCVHWSMWTEEHLIFRLTINTVQLVFDFPCSEPLVFIHCIKNQGKITTLIPFITMFFLRKKINLSQLTHGLIMRRKNFKPIKSVTTFESNVSPNISNYSIFGGRND